MKHCVSCKQNKHESDFHQQTKIKGGKKYINSSCKDCDNQRLAERKRSIKEQLIILGGGKCKKCGYDKCSWALEFHHRESEDKNFALNRARSINSSILKELEKCDLLCNRCHREIHYEIYMNSKII